MNEQIKQMNTQPEQHSHKVLYASLGLLVLAVVLLLVVVGGMYYKGKQTLVATTYTQTQKQVIQPGQTTQQTPQQQLQQSLTPVPVTTKKDLTTQQNALDNTDMTAITTGLDQNTADASQFSQ